MMVRWEVGKYKVVMAGVVYRKRVICVRAYVCVDSTTMKPKNCHKTSRWVASGCMRRAGKGRSVKLPKKIEENLATLRWRCVVTYVRRRSPLRGSARKEQG